MKQLWTQKQNIIYEQMNVESQIIFCKNFFFIILREKHYI